MLGAGLVGTSVAGLAVVVDEEGIAMVVERVLQSTTRVGELVTVTVGRTVGDGVGRSVGAGVCVGLGANELAVVGTCVGVTEVGTSVGAGVVGATVGAGVVGATVGAGVVDTVHDSSKGSSSNGSLHGPRTIVPSLLR